MFDKNNSKLNSSIFDLSCNLKDRSYFGDRSFISASFLNGRKLNRSIIADYPKEEELNEDDAYSTNLNRLYISLDETRDLKLTNLDDLSDEDKILKFCKPRKLVKFDDVLRDDPEIVKVAEGSYGEIYKLVENNLILKLIRLTQDLDQILPEIIIGFALNELQKKFNFHNFIKFKRCSFIQDKYPDKFLKAWNDYNEEVKESENDDPSTFDCDDKYILLVLENGGQDLESIEQLEPRTAISIFKQVILSLAIGEYSIDLEHRDLHVGNILIKNTNEQELVYEFDNRKFKVETNGYHVNIIDYTLTRLTKNGVTIYQDLNETPEIFEGKGDIQYDVYR